MASSKPEMPGVERLVSAAPTDDTARERVADPGSLQSAGRNWTPFGLVLMGHQISINPTTGGLTISVSDAEAPYHSLPLCVSRTYDAQEQYAQWRWIDGHPDTDPRFHLFGNWQMNREVQVSEVWRSTYPEIMVADGAGDSGLFYREWSAFSTETRSSAAVEECLRAYGVPGRTLAALGWTYSAGDILLKTRQGTPQLLTGKLLPETMSDRAKVSLWRFDPVRGVAARITSEHAYEQLLLVNGDREVTVPGLVTRVIDAVGHTLDFEPGEAAPPFRTYRLRTGAGQEMRLEIEARPVYRDGYAPTKYVQMGLVARVVDLTRDTSNVVGYAYDDSGRLDSVAFPARAGGSAARVFRYTYDDRGLLVGITDPIGDAVRFEYVEDLTDIDDRLTERIKLSRIVDGEGNAMSYRYDHAHGAVVVTMNDPGGAARSVTYGYLEDVPDTGQRYVTSEVTVATLGFSGNQTIRTLWDYSNDGRFLLIRATDPEGAISRFEYNAYNQLAATIDPSGHRRDLEYDVVAPPTSAAPNRYDLVRASEENVDIDGATFLVESRFEYERYGTVTSSDPADTAESTHRVVARTDPNGHRWQYRYDDANNAFALRPSATIDPLGATTTCRYDSVGSQVEESDATGVSHRWEYDSRGLILASEDANGNRRTWLRDAATGWALAATDAFGAAPGDPAHSTLYEWNDAGQLLAQQDAVGARTEYEYRPSKRLRLVRRFDPAPREIGFEYDAVGALLAISDPAGHRTLLRYDEAGRLFETLRDTGLAPPIRFVMDRAGRVIRLVDRNGQETRIDYDVLGRIVALAEPNWPVATLANAGKQCTFEYDRLGRRLRAVDSELPGAVEYRFDPAGNLIRRSGPFQIALSWEYDARNGLARVHDDTNAIDLRFERDAAGRMIAVSDSARFDPARRFRYDWTSGALVDNLYGVEAEGIGLHTHLAYDADRQLTSITHDVGGVPVAEFGYGYRPDGLIGATTGDHVGEYDFDGVKRLINETDAGVRSGYDAVGNRLWRAPAQPPAAKFSTYDADNKLIDAPIEGTAYEYDANGARTKRTAGSRGTTYTFDSGGRLSLVDGAGQTVKYVYDSDGHLLERTFSDSAQTVVRRYVLANRTVLARIDSNGDFKTLYTRDDDGRLLRRRDADPISNPPAVDPHSLYYVADGRLNIARLVDAAGGDRARFDLDAWGSTLSQSGSFASGEMFRYRSGHRDRETGLYQFGARWYDPQVGRWLSQDPLLQGLILAHDDVLPRWADLSNLYVYASNSPVMLFDPGGLIAHLPKGWPTPPGWKGGYKWKNGEKGDLVDPAGQRWHWHPDDTSHNEHWDMKPRKGPKRRVDRNGKDLGDEAFKADDVKPEPVSDWDRVPKTEEVVPDVAEGISSGGGGSSTAKYVAGGAATVGGGIGLWELGKWTIAVLATPVTEGGSLAAAGALP